MAASQPPSSAAHAPPRTTLWRAPAYPPAQPASSEHDGGLTAATRGSSRATPHHTVVHLPDSSCVERVLGSECVTAVVHTVHPVHLAATPVARSCYVVTVVEPDPVTACTEGCKARNLRFRERWVSREGNHSTPDATGLPRHNFSRYAVAPRAKSPRWRGERPRTRTQNKMWVCTVKSKTGSSTRTA